jgi:hypothetical protein
MFQLSTSTVEGSFPAFPFSNLNPRHPDGEVSPSRQASTYRVLSPTLTSRPRPPPLVHLMRPFPKTWSQTVQRCSALALQTSCRASALEEPLDSGRYFISGLELLRRVSKSQGRLTGSGHMAQGQERIKGFVQAQCPEWAGSSPRKIAVRRGYSSIGYAVAEDADPRNSRAAQAERIRSNLGYRVNSTVKRGFQAFCLQR